MHHNYSNKYIILTFLIQMLKMINCNVFCIVIFVSIFLRSYLSWLTFKENSISIYGVQPRRHLLWAYQSTSGVQKHYWRKSVYSTFVIETTPFLWTNLTLLLLVFTGIKTLYQMIYHKCWYWFSSGLNFVQVSDLSVNK